MSPSNKHSYTNAMLQLLFHVPELRLALLRQQVGGNTHNLLLISLLGGGVAVRSEHDQM